MKRPLDSSPEVISLAHQMGLGGNSPLNELLAYCDRRVRAFIRQFPDCDTLSSLLQISAQLCGTQFEVADSSCSLDTIISKYTARNEPVFAILEHEFMRGVLGITLRLHAPQPWELPFVSVIDTRGDRRKRSYFTKWHEIAHLLLLTDERQTRFQRTHNPGAETDVEEALVDLVAGRCAFHPALVLPHANCQISFPEIERLRMQLCPESSKQAARLGFTAAWPTPCILLECELAAPRFGHSPETALRATSVTVNEAARSLGLTIPQFRRVPSRSVISHMFGRVGKSGEAEEDLIWWASHSSHNLVSRQVLVKALARTGGVDALVIPV